MATSILTGSKAMHWQRPSIFTSTGILTFVSSNSTDYIIDSTQMCTYGGGSRQVGGKEFYMSITSLLTLIKHNSDFKWRRQFLRSPLLISRISQSRSFRRHIYHQVCLIVHSPVSQVVHHIFKELSRYKLITGSVFASSILL
jgi:hypothetical protein